MSTKEGEGPRTSVFGVPVVPYKEEESLSYRVVEDSCSIGSIESFRVRVK